MKICSPAKKSLRPYYSLFSPKFCHDIVMIFERFFWGEKLLFVATFSFLPEKIC